MYLSRIHDLLAVAEADGVLITSPENIFYLSGFTGSAGYALITKNSAVLFVDSRYTVQGVLEAKDFEIEESLAGSYENLSARLTQENISILAFEDMSISVARYNLLKESLVLTLIPLGDKITRLRRIKNLHEIARITEAVRLADNAFEYIVNNIKVGMSEVEIAAMLEYHMRQAGASSPSFSTICASGVRSAMPHGKASGKIIEQGDLVTMDFGCILDGYCSDMTRTVVMGAASSLQKEIYHIVLYANRRAQDEAVPNMKAADLDKVARDIIDNFGYGENFGHSLGHGVGINVHELPVLSPRSADLVEPGAVITIEPGIYLEGFGGVRIEDMVAVNNTGSIVLTNSPKELLELGKL